MNLNTDKLIKEYIEQTGSRAKENANQWRSYAGLKGYITGYPMADYALRNIYSKELAEAHEKGFVHINDLNGLCAYCYGLDFQELLHQGLKGDDGSTPPEYFDTALGITETFIMKLSSQIAGAVAVNSPDILLAPYIKKNKLTYKEVRHILKQFIYRINTRVRGSYEAPFTNFQLDITVPNRLKKVRPVIQGIKQDFTYQDCQKEVDMFNMALLDILDETNKPFPVVNMGIAKDFDWDSPIAEKIFKSIGTFGQPVISNYVNSDYDPDTTRSMCCSLRLDMSKIMKGSSSFGSNNGSGSVGVVTINLALLGCVAKDEAELLELIGKYMDLAKDGLNSKRAFVEDWHERDMYPTLKQFSKDLRSLFSTIGVVGMNEMCLGLIGKGIDSEDGLSLSERVADYMNNKLSQYQVESENWYNGHGVFWNLEVVPAEGATRRLAQAMKKHFPDLAITSNGTQKDYITRGCWLPADKQYTLAYACEHQDRIQKKFSGGCNFNWYLESPIKDGKAVKSILYKIINNTSLPFISISPPVNVCPVCGKHVDDYCEHDISDEEIKERGLKTYEEN